MMNKNIIISIEGNIGSGKSTLLSKLREIYEGTDKTRNNNIILLKEPVDDWEEIKDSNGNTMLQKFYLDQEKYSFPFQMMAYISRLALLKTTIQQNPNAIIITERSLYTDKYVFAKMLHDNGKIEDVNYQIYSKWFDTFAVDFPVEKLIYVKTEPTICHDRIAKRSRTGEDCIPLDYLINCHKYHEDMIKYVYNGEESQYIIDGNIDIHDTPEALDLWLDEINKIITNITIVN